MRVAERVYISEILKPERERLIRRIKADEKVPWIYCITMPLWKSAILEIYSYNDLRSWLYESEDIIIVGLAVGEDDAKVVLRRIIDDLARCQMLEDVEDYFCGEC